MSKFKNCFATANDMRDYDIVIDGEPRDYPEAVKMAYADILIDAEPAPEAEEAIEPDDNEYDGGY